MMKNVIEQAKENDSDKKIADFKVKQAQNYSFKKKYAYARAWEFYNHPDIAGNCYIAVGGLDSITLLLFLRAIGINVPAVSVSVLEDKSIIISSREGCVKENIDRKQQDCERMHAAMVEQTREITRKELQSTCRMDTPYRPDAALNLPAWKEFSA